MPADNFAPSLSLVLKEEGGFTDRRSDPGNWTGGKVGKGQLKGTKYGIAASSHPDLDIANLTLEQAGAIYRPEYWAAAGCDALPAGVDLVVFDPAVNAGVSRARRWRDATAQLADPQARIQAICAARRAFYQGLTTFRTFGKGWLARVSRIEAAATRMALEAAGLAPAAVQLALAKASKRAGSTATTARSSAKATASTAGIGGAVTAANVPDASAIPHLGVIVAVIAAAAGVVAIAILAHRARAHDTRAEAFAAEAAALATSQEKAA